MNSAPINSAQPSFGMALKLCDMDLLRNVSRENANGFSKMCNKLHKYSEKTGFDIFISPSDVDGEHIVDVVSKSRDIGRTFYVRNNKVYSAPKNLLQKLFDYMKSEQNKIIRVDDLNNKFSYRG